MFPLIVDVAELRLLKAMVPPLADEFGIKPEAYVLGTMIEVPRAAVVADDLAEEAAFFSFGTNDLTQTALGISRDDAAHFLPAYVGQGLWKKIRLPVSIKSVSGRLLRWRLKKGAPRAAI